MKDTRITVRFTADLRKGLKDAARRKGKRKSDVVREAVEQQFSTEDAALTAHDRAMELGLIGAVRGAAPDLSVNPKHFDGFGGS
jgi:predicted DNA-binding protein